MQLKLKDAQIKQVEQELRQKGLFYDPLHEDLVDHVCCEIEALITSGASFGQAYKQVLEKYERRGIDDINRETTTLLGHITMIRNYLTTTLRLFRKNLLSNSIRILGLSVGIAIFLIVILYWSFEHSYDQFHNDSESIYRLGRVTDLGQEMNTAFPLVPTLRVDYPEYQFTQFFKDRSRSLFRHERSSYYEAGLAWADGEFLKFFNFDGFVGDPNTALIQPFSVILTEAVARKYFGEVPALGETLELRWNGQFYPLKITGLIPQWPEAMHIEFDILVSLSTSEQVFPGDITNSWDMNYCFAYVKLPQNILPGQFESDFSRFVQQHVFDEQADTREYLGALQPLTDVHTEPEVLGGYTKTIDGDYLRLGLGIGFVILLIASLNFVTLTVAQFQERTREVGIRKAIGAYRSQIVNLFLFETLVLITASFIIGFLIMQGLLWIGDRLYAVPLTTDYFWRTEFLIGIPLLIVGLTLVTGLYPAVVISSSNVLRTIKLSKSASGNLIRKFLMGLQFLVAACLISFCWIVYEQLDYIQNQALGYNKEQVLIIPHARQIRFNPDTFRNNALNHPGIQNVALSFYKPGDDITTNIDLRVNGQEAKNIAVNSVDESFFETYEIDLIDGIGFDTDRHNLDSVFIVNQAALTYLNIDNPFSATLDTSFRTGDPNLPVETRQGRIVGIIEDVHFESMHNQIKPMIFLVKPYWYFYINVRIDTSNMNSAIDHLQNAWLDLFPEQPFEYQFLDQEFARLYANEELMGRSLIALTLLAVFTACMGLFGYIRLLAGQMLKEISIRKILGANLLQIIVMVARSCLWSVIWAGLLSWPLVYFLSQRWLENYSYQPDQSFLPYLIAFITLFLVAVLTVSREMLRMGRLNPVETLRYD